MKRNLVHAVVATALVGLCGNVAFAAQGGGSSDSGNPYHPANGHAYRHGVIPTRETLKNMHASDAAHPSTQAAAASSNTLYSPRRHEQQQSGQCRRDDRHYQSVSGVLRKRLGHAEHEFER
jgi:hypothetical protein